MYDKTFAGGSTVDPSTPETWPRPTAAVLPAAADQRALQVRICRPARSVLQAGRANTGHWLLKFEPRSASFIEPLMGWTSTQDTLRQVRLKFPTREQAVAFARRHGWACTVIEPRTPTVRPKCYAENLRYRHPRSAAGRTPAMVPGPGAAPASTVQATKS